jgi:hypothetical protein
MSEDRKLSPEEEKLRAEVIFKARRLFISMTIMKFLIIAIMIVAIWKFAR